MRKDEIIYEIAKKNRIETAKVEAVVEAFMSTVKEKLLDKRTIHLRGFGNFHLKKKAAKKARIIHKNMQIIIPEHFAPAFRPAKRFRDMVKRGTK